MGLNLLWCPYKKRKFKYKGCLCTPVCVCVGCVCKCAHAEQRQWGHSEEATSASHGERPQGKPNLPAPWSWISDLQNYEKLNFCHLNHLFYYGIPSKITRDEYISEYVHLVICTAPTTLMTESKELKNLLMRVKEESEKVGLKFNIKKTNTMASGPTTSW